MMFLKSSNALASVITTSVLLLLIAPMILFAQWEYLEGPDGGSVVKLFEKSDGTIFASTSTAGVFVSADNAASWNYTGLEDASHIVFAESPSGRLFFVKIYSDQIFYSDDNLTTINSIAGPESSRCEGIYVFSDTDIIIGARQNGILRFDRTTDGGQTWSTVLNNSAQVFRPIFIPFEDGLILGYDYGQDLKYTPDSGESWISMNVPWNGMDPLYQILPTHDGNLIVTTGTSAYRSSDNGSTWVEVLNDSLQSFDNGCVTTDGMIYLRSNHNLTYISDDDGQTWNVIEDNLDTGEKSNVMISASGNLILGTEYGIYVSNNSGSSWTESSIGLRDYVPSSISVSNEGQIFAGFENLPGLYIYEPGSGWSSNPELGSSVAVNEDGIIFSAKPDGEINRSDDNGDSWIQTAGFAEPTTFCTLFDSPGSHLFAFANGPTGFYLYRSDDNGESFTQLDPLGVYDFTYGPDGTLYVATVMEGFGFSLDNGNSWIFPVPEPGINNVEVASDGTLYSSEFTSVQVSHNGGMDWTDIHANVPPDSLEFPGVHVNIFNVDADGNVYIDLSWYSNWEVNISDQGVYVSEDQGLSWTKSADWRAGYFVKGFDDSFYAGTSHGIYKNIANSSDVSENSRRISTFELAQNYPNPFNPATSISFILSEAGQTELSVYNMLGQHVKSLVNNNLSAGNHSITFDGSTLASGIYFYKLKQGNQSKVRRMLLVK